MKVKRILLSPLTAGAALFVCVLFSALGNVVSTYQVRQMVNEFQLSKQRQHELEVEWGRLLLEYSAWGTYQRLESLAVRQGMLRPDSANIITLETER